MTRADRRRRNEGGHLMAGLVVAVAIMLIFSTVVFQEWSEVLRRDNEAEMIFRAQQYTRGIWHFRQLNGREPLKLEELMEPQGPGARIVMRQLYDDPLVKDGKWGLLYIGPGGQIVDPASQQQGIGLGQGLNQGTSPFGNSPGQSAFGNNQNQNQNQNQRQNPNRTGNTGTGLGQGNNPGSTGGFGSGSSLSGSGEITGLPIAGVRTLSEDEPFRVYKESDEYREWLFTWQDVEAQLGQGLPGQNNTQPGAGNTNRGRNRGQQPGLGGSGMNRNPASMPGRNRGGNRGNNRGGSGRGP